jgi:hypothetical protein
MTMVVSSAEGQASSENQETVRIDADPFPAAIEHYGIDALAASDDIDDDDPLVAVRQAAAEYVVRQFLNHHCPTWTTFLVEAILSCIDVGKAVRVGVLPGDGAGKNRNSVYEHRASGENYCLWVTRQAVADPLDAGISPMVFVAGQLVLRQRHQMTYSLDTETPALVCFAKPDPELSGRQARIHQLLVPKSFVWAEGATRISTLTRGAFAQLVEKVRQTIFGVLEVVPSWNVARLMDDDLERMKRTTMNGKRPSNADKKAINLGISAIRNWVGIDPQFAMQLAQVDYVYRRYEVLR